LLAGGQAHLFSLRASISSAAVPVRARGPAEADLEETRAANDLLLPAPRPRNKLAGI
jgi:hypothetical protein